tara:strand:+ start:402 stop:584 length:183 start_codon:yes stop_codon:yes gene_type:complete
MLRENIENKNASNAKISINAESWWLEYFSFVFIVEKKWDNENKISFKNTVIGFNFDDSLP